MVHRRTLLSAAGTALAATLAGCTDALAGPGDDGEDESTESTAETATPTPTPEPSAELVSSELIRRDAGSDDELVSVSGVVENVADESLAEIVVTATFRDGDGTVLGTAEADLTDVSPGKRWQFRIYFHGSGERAALVADHSLDVVVEN